MNYDPDKLKLVDVIVNLYNKLELNHVCKL